MLGQRPCRGESPNTRGNHIPLINAPVTRAITESILSNLSSSIFSVFSFYPPPPFSSPIFLLITSFPSIFAFISLSTSFLLLLSLPLLSNFYFLPFLPYLSLLFLYHFLCFFLSPSFLCLLVLHLSFPLEICLLFTIFHFLYISPCPFRFFSFASSLLPFLFVPFSLIPCPFYQLYPLFLLIFPLPFPLSSFSPTSLDHSSLFSVLLYTLPSPIPFPSLLFSFVYSVHLFYFLYSCPLSLPSPCPFRFLPFPFPLSIVSLSLPLFFLLLLLSLISSFNPLIPSLSLSLSLPNSSSSNSLFSLSLSLSLSLSPTIRSSTPLLSLFFLPSISSSNSLLPLSFSLLQFVLHLLSSPLFLSLSPFHFVLQPPSSPLFPSLSLSPPFHPPLFPSPPFLSDVSPRRHIYIKI
ncbi:hypothetical protein C7M84_021481 [Penaeus vannamei]|uniref:Uncharacterized protein n=1 Tax=Penaeus vannamei TaxID=6689 RepID=A0A423U8K4_PENVA|nr:hypothetical protein C7M84_021481 [Penaeus vannamei]